MPILQLLLLSIIQGLAELLPVSSSAHVIVAQKLLGIDPSAPEMTFLLVMLHTGTMFAVLLFFWKRWQRILRSPERKRFIQMLALATLLTGVVGYGLKHILEHWVLTPEPGQTKAQVESLFKNLWGVSAAVFSAGVLITWAGLRAQKKSAQASTFSEHFTPGNASLVGIFQGICIPFRGFSRSGATISASLLRGIPQTLAEDFSFALVVILTPAAIYHLVKRLLESVALQPGGASALNQYLSDGLFGMVFAFVAGLAALKWLSSWLENGKWHYFGIYCLAFSAVTFWLACQGY